MIRGPCNRPEMQQLLIPETLEGAGQPWLLTNFGLLLPRTSEGAAPAANAAQGTTKDATKGTTRYELLCEETFGGKVPTRVVRHPAGRLLVPGSDGLYLSTEDTCGFTRAEGSVAGRQVLEVAIDPVSPAKLWALVASPPGVHLSQDAGATFQAGPPLPEDFRPARVLVGDTSAPFIYLSGYSATHPLVLLVSEDGGRSFVTRQVEPAVFARRATATDLLAVLPGSPPVLLLAAGSPDGPDQIWRSTDGGVTWTMALTMEGMQVQSGFAVGAGPPGSRAVYVAGRELFLDPGKPAAHLYVSSDDGLSFAQRIPSGPTGPTYRCLASHGGRLYACAGERDDSFLAGASDDGGKSWTAVATLADVQGQRACAGGRCLATAIWLCEFYGAACEGLAPLDGRADPPPDGGPDAQVPGPPAAAGDGCGCRLSAGSPTQPPLAAIMTSLAALLAALIRRRGGRRIH